MITGSSDKTPMICIHGFTGSWRHWVPVTAALEQHHQVHVARLAGHARGPAVPTGVAVTVQALADQLERDLDRAGIGQAHLVGNSLGGWLALEMAARGRALSVLALSPALGWAPRGAHLRSLRNKLRTGRRLISATAPYAESLLAPKSLRRSLFRTAIAHADRITVVEAAAFMRDNLRCTIFDELMDSFLTTEAQLGPIPCPVHIAWSQHDALLPQHPYGSRFPTLVPHAQVTVLPGVGHVPMFDDPDLIARTIIDFTTGIDGADQLHSPRERIPEDPHHAR